MLERYGDVGWDTYILQVDDNDIIDGEVRIRSHKLITDNLGCRRDPLFVPVGLAKILKFVPWM
jgi:hypothetical protein